MQNMALSGGRLANRCIAEPLYAVSHATQARHWRTPAVVQARRPHPAGSAGRASATASGAAPRGATPAARAICWSVTDRYCKATHGAGATRAMVGLDVGRKEGVPSRRRQPDTCLPATGAGRRRATPSWLRLLARLHRNPWLCAVDDRAALVSTVDERLLGAMDSRLSHLSR